MNLKKNKVLVITPYFSPQIGGAENYALNISRGLNKINNWEVIIVTSNNKKKENIEDKIDGMKIFRLPYWLKISNTPVNPLWYFQIKKIIQNEKPNVIIAHTPVPIISDITARISGNIPFVLTYHNDLAKENLFLNYLCKLYYITLGKKTLAISNKIITISSFYAKNSPYLKPYLNNVGIIPPGVNLSIFNLKVSKNKLKKRYGNYLFMLFVGQLDKAHEYKGINYLLEAFVLVRKELTNIKLILVGEGDNTENYKKKAKELGIYKHVIFAGIQLDKKLAEFYSGSVVNILPSYDRSEGFGMVLIEAGATGIPVIGTKVGGIPFVIDNDKTGLLVPPKNSKALAKAIIKIAKNSKLAKEMGEEGYEKVKHDFTWSIQVSKTRKVIEEVLNNK